MLLNKSNPNKPFRSDDYPEMERDVIQERLRQAKFSFNATLWLAIVSASISIVAEVLNDRKRLLKLAKQCIIAEL